LRGWIHDLDAGAPETPLETDVCVLGAGPVGLTLARSLAEKGRRVTLLEIGGSTAASGSAMPTAIFDRREYGGATVGRAFGLGGTSALWGGQLLPLRPADLLARPQIQTQAWPLAYADVEPYFQALQEYLGVSTSGFDLASLLDPNEALLSLDFTDWTPRLSRWLAFGRRNIATAWDAQLRRHPGISVWVNAQTQDWQLSGPSGKRTVLELVAVSPRGASLRVQPKAVVIAGGALESARAVLELNDQAGPLSSGVSDLAGRFLHDHISLRIARLHIIDPSGFEERFAPFFESSTMRTLRLELPREILESAGIPALYAHFIAIAPSTSGFALLRDCLRLVQRRDFGAALAAAFKLPGALPDIVRLAYARIVKQRLAYPKTCEFYLHIDVEQAPRHANRVYLGALNGAARRPLHIDWDVEEDARRITQAVRHYFERFWARNDLNLIGTLEFQEDAEGWGRNVHDLYHPAGTTRMSVDPALGVVDVNLKVHGTSNVYVAGSSVFPSMGAANPTFTAMALALRLAHFIHGTGCPP
jgi:choline dehydrogenase-like flavoprotein